MSPDSVEMGVPMDRGLTHGVNVQEHFGIHVEMGVPMNRGLTHLI